MTRVKLTVATPRRAVAIAFAREGADVAITHLGAIEEEDARETRGSRLTPAGNFSSCL